VRQAATFQRRLLRVEAAVVSALGDVDAAKRPAGAVAIGAVFGRLDHLCLVRPCPFLPSRYLTTFTVPRYPESQFTQRLTRRGARGQRCTLHLV